MAGTENSFSIEKQLTCSICIHLFRDPVTLPCCHSFCKKCATAATVCPICGKAIKIPASELRSNSALKTVTEILVEHCNKTQNISKEFACDVCDVAVVSSDGLRCSDCRITYCSSCRNTCHPDKGAFSKHKIEAGMGRSDTTRIITECLSHKKEFVYFCLDCKTTLCLDCQRESHKSHVCEVLSKAYSDECGKMISTIEGSEAAHKKGAGVVASRSQHLASMKNNQTQRIQRIHESFQSLKMVLDTKERELLDREEVLVTKPLRKFESIMRNTETDVVFLGSLLTVSEAVTKQGEELPLLIMSSPLMKELQKHSSSLSMLDNDLPELPTVPDNIDITDAINCINLLGVELNVSADKRGPEGCPKEEHSEEVPKAATRADVPMLTRNAPSFSEKESENIRTFASMTDRKGYFNHEQMKEGYSIMRKLYPAVYADTSVQNEACGINTSMGNTVCDDRDAFGRKQTQQCRKASSYMSHDFSFPETSSDRFTAVGSKSQTLGRGDAYTPHVYSNGRTHESVDSKTETPILKSSSEVNGHNACMQVNSARANTITSIDDQLKYDLSVAFSSPSTQYSNQWIPHNADDNENPNYSRGKVKTKEKKTKTNTKKH